MKIGIQRSWVDRLLWLALAAGTTGFVLGGCAHRDTRPDDLSAAAHRQVAERESALAAGEYSPTERHLRTAADHARHAREHERAAAELERFEDSACGPLPAAERAACPVMGPI